MDGVAVEDMKSNNNGAGIEKSSEDDIKMSSDGARIETSSVKDIKTSRQDADLESVHSVDQAALVWKHMRENSGLSDEADSLYDETGLMGPPWL